MKNSLKLILIAALGGMLSLGGYRLIFPAPQVKTYIEPAPSLRFQGLPANYQPNEDNSFVLAAEKTVNSVVHVKTAVRSRYQAQSPLEFFFGMPQQRQPGGRLQMGTGSGVIISADGYIVTNNHVVARAEDILVTLNNGQEYDAEVVGADPTTDIALLKVEAADLPYVTFSNSDQLQVGEWVLAVGNPFNLTSTVTAGIVSAKARNIGIINERAAIESFIQTDAAVNPGNSGGALVNTRGQLVGINTAISTRTGSYEGYSFAVPSNIAKKVVEDLREYGTVQRAFIGVNIRDISPRLADELELEVTNGVYIAGVSDQGAAAEAGIESGDVIVAVNERPVRKTSELQEIIGRKRPGEEVQVTVLRKGKERKFSLTLRNANGTTKRISKEDIEFLTLLGGTFRSINDEEKERYGLRYGVRVTAVNSGILAEQGIPEGFIITSVNQEAVYQPEDINAAVENKPEGHPVVLFGMLPNGRQKYYVFEW